MSGAQVNRRQAELRLWRAMLRETDGELRNAFAARDRGRIRQLEREGLAIRMQVSVLHALLDAVPRAV